MYVYNCTRGYVDNAHKTRQVLLKNEFPNKTQFGRKLSKH